MALLKDTELNYPFTGTNVRKLKAGDRVKLSGRVFTGRDRLHRYLADGGTPPVDLKDGAIFHCGPIAILKDGKWSIQAAGPTTSLRQDPYMPEIIEKYRVRVIIGKGGMGPATRAACIKYGCVYLQTIGGAGALLAKCVVSVDGVHFSKEFGSADALWELETKDLPAVVAIDSNGRSIYKRVNQNSHKALNELLKQSVHLD
jgi:tartrate/fumarate subfamily iron-sulfur-dependent hydro-lyase beta chain